MDVGSAACSELCVPHKNSIRSNQDLTTWTTCFKPGLSTRGLQFSPTNFCRPFESCKMKWMSAKERHGARGNFHSAIVQTLREYRGKAVWVSGWVFLSLFPLCLHAIFRQRVHLKRYSRLNWRLLLAALLHVIGSADRKSMLASVAEKRVALRTLRPIFPMRWFW